MRRPALLVVSLSLLFLLSASPSSARTRARYLVELADGSRFTAIDAPVLRGNVLTFHTNGGALTGVPREMVARLVSLGPGGASAAVIRSVPAAPAAVESSEAGALVPPTEILRPGDVLLLGPLTDVGPTLAESAAAAAGAGTGAATAVGVPAYPGPMGYGGGLSPYAVNPNGTPVLPRAPSTTDLALALARTPVGPNGFPIMTNGSPTVVGPDGVPTLAPGVPGSSTPAIGPNGTPLIGETGSSPIGPNGTPVLAPSGQPGSSPPVIGPNGTPALAPSGQPGSSPVVIAPNGTPELAPSGQAGSVPVVIGPNGTPVLAPGGQAGAAPNAMSIASPAAASAASRSSRSGSGSGPRR